MIVHHRHLYNSYLGYHDGKELVSVCWGRAVGCGAQVAPDRPASSASENAIFLAIGGVTCAPEVSVSLESRAYTARTHAVFGTAPGHGPESREPLATSLIAE
jgi:hypothetical protein